MNDVFDEFANLIGQALANRWLRELDARRRGSASRQRRNPRIGAEKPKKASKRRPTEKNSDGEHDASTGR